jgi:hypothetical protein
MPGVKKQGPERQFRAAPGARFSNEQAQRYGTFLERKVGLDKGFRSPQDVVDACRDPKAPPHVEFTWDIQQAAEERWLDQARQLVNHILVVRDERTDDGEEQTTKAFHSVMVTTETGHNVRRYTSEKIVWSSPVLADQIVNNAMRELTDWTARHEQYSDLRESVGLVKEAIRRGRGKRTT